MNTRVESLIQEVKQVYVYFARGNTKVCPFFISQHCCQALNLLFCSLQVTDKPVAVGFGISRPEHVKQVRERSYNHISADLLIKQWLISSWPNLLTFFRSTDCGVGSRWSYHRQCNGETVRRSSISQRRSKTARGLHQEHEECITIKYECILHDL